MTDLLETIRLKLASIEAQPLLALLGIISGLVSGVVIIAFRLVIETSQTWVIGLDNPEDYESLSLMARFVLPLLGGLLIGIIFSRIDKKNLQLGVVHVLERLSYYQGNMPVRNFILQFITGAISIICGHSVGREGPGIHLGAASSSFIAQALKLPNNTIRILVGCGAAASIAASFNTPIAGVIFAMEVIMMEYTIAGFTPIILATVSATLLTRVVYGNSPAFIVPSLQMASLYEVPILLVMGIVMGALAATFTELMKVTTARSREWPIVIRTTLAGALIGACALLLPEIMGVGYDTVNAAMLGQLGLGLLAGIVILKLLATTLGLGLGLPGGLIGPTMVIGAAAGGFLGMVAHTLFSGDVASAGFYAMLGLGAMMGATLQAPLAALMAMLELTNNTHIILPGMLVVIIASLSSSHLFRQQGIFRVLLRARGRDIKQDPVSQSLRRHGVASVMTRSFVRMEQYIPRAKAEELLRQEPQWIVIQREGQPHSIMLPADLAAEMRKEQQASVDAKLETKKEAEAEVTTEPATEVVAEQELNLLEIPAKRVDSVQISIRLTLQQALETMDAQHVDVVYIGHTAVNGSTIIQGLITRQMIESHYHF